MFFFFFSEKPQACGWCSFSFKLVFFFFLFIFFFFCQQSTQIQQLPLLSEEVRCAGPSRRPPVRFLSEKASTLTRGELLFSGEYTSLHTARMCVYRCTWYFLLCFRLFFVFFLVSVFGCVWVKTFFFFSVSVILWREKMLTRDVARTIRTVKRRRFRCTCDLLFGSECTAFFPSPSPFSSAF